MQITLTHTDHLPDLAQILRASTRDCGYPVQPVADVTAWIGRARSWCAVDLQGGVVGHVAVLDHVHPDTSTLDLPGQVDVARTAELARLVVDPRRKGGGVGLALHDHAVAAITGRGQRPLLWVQEHLHRARGFYQDLGWQTVATCRGSETGRVNHVLLLGDDAASDAVARASARAGRD